MTQELFKLVLGATSGIGASLWARRRAKAHMAQAEADLLEAASVEQLIDAGRDAMLAEGRMVLSGAYLAAEYFGVPLTLYREPLAALPEVHPPPELAQKLAEIPTFHFDYSQPDIEPLAVFLTNPLPEREAARVVHATHEALRHGHPNVAALGLGVKLASKGMAAWKDASQYRAQARNYCAEVRRVERSCLEAFERDACALRQSVELLLDCLDGGYQGVCAIAARGAPWEALSAEDRLTLENHYFPMAQIHMLCRLPAFRVFEETAV
jgi:hypothetical protein